MHSDKANYSMTGEYHSFVTVDTMEGSCNLELISLLDSGRLDPLLGKRICERVGLN